MGLAHVPETFIWMMNNFFMDMLNKGIVVFLDNILIYSTMAIGAFQTTGESIHMLA